MSDSDIYEGNEEYDETPIGVDLSLHDPSPIDSEDYDEPVESSMRSNTLSPVSSDKPVPSPIRFTFNKPAGMPVRSKSPVRTFDPEGSGRLSPVRSISTMPSLPWHALDTVPMPGTFGLPGEGGSLSRDLNRQMGINDWYDNGDRTETFNVRISDEIDELMTRLPVKLWTHIKRNKNYEGRLYIRDISDKTGLSMFFLGKTYRIPVVSFTYTQVHNIVNLFSKVYDKIYVYVDTTGLHFELNVTYVDKVIPYDLAGLIVAENNKRFTVLARDISIFGDFAGEIFPQYGPPVDFDWRLRGYLESITKDLDSPLNKNRWIIYNEISTLLSMREDLDQEFLQLIRSIIMEQLGVDIKFEKGLYGFQVFRPQLVYNQLWSQAVENKKRKHLLQTNLQEFLPDVLTQIPSEYI